MTEVKESVEWIIANIPGAEEVRNWFGYWPDFHDAEIISLELNRNKASTLSVFFCNTDGQRVTPEGYFYQDKHVVVHFEMEGITDLQLSEFNHQNVISELILKKIEEGVEILMDGCYGMFGTITAESVKIAMTQGKPQDDA